MRASKDSDSRSREEVLEALMCCWRFWTVVSMLANVCWNRAVPAMRTWDEGSRLCVGRVEVDGKGISADVGEFMMQD